MYERIKKKKKINTDDLKENLSSFDINSVRSNKISQIKSEISKL